MVQISKDSCVALDEIFDRLRAIYNNIVHYHGAGDRWQDRAQGDDASSEETDLVKSFICLFLEVPSVLFYNPNQTAGNIQWSHTQDDYENGIAEFSNANAYHPLERGFLGHANSRIYLIIRVMFNIIEQAYETANMSHMRQKSGEVYFEYLKARNVLTTYINDIVDETYNAFALQPKFIMVRRHNRTL